MIEPAKTHTRAADRPRAQWSTRSSHLTGRTQVDGVASGEKKRTQRRSKTGQTYKDHAAPLLALVLLDLRAHGRLETAQRQARESITRGPWRPWRGCAAAATRAAPEGTTQGTEGGGGWGTRPTKACVVNVARVAALRRWGLCPAPPHGDSRRQRQPPPRDGPRLAG